MTELGQKILKYILSKTTKDNKYIYVPEIEKHLGNLPEETFNPAFAWAKDMGYINTTYMGYATPQGQYTYITSAGREYLEKEELSKRLQQETQTKELQRYTEEKRRSWIQFWVPFVFSTFISILALIVAILAYLKQ